MVQETARFTPPPAEAETSYRSRPDGVSAPEIGYYPIIAQRTWWGAILAGAFATLGLQAIFTMLGIAIGITLIEPTEANAVPDAIGVGAGIWWVVTGILSLFAGGWIAGRLAGIRRTTEGALHGMLSWAVVTVLSFVLVTTTASTLLGGMMNMLQASASAVAQGATSATQAVASNMPDANVNVDWTAVREDVRNTLQETGNPALQPEELKEEAQGAADTLTQAGEEALRNPQQAEQIVMEALRSVLNRGERIASEVEREDVVDIVVARTGLSREQARQAVIRWEETYQQAWQQVSSTVEQLPEQIEQTADQAVDALAGASWWMCIALAMGAAAATVGGCLGGLPGPSRGSVSLDDSTPRSERRRT